MMGISVAYFSVQEHVEFRYVVEKFTMFLWNEVKKISFPFCLSSPVYSAGVE